MAKMNNMAIAELLKKSQEINVQQSIAIQELSQELTTWNKIKETEEWFDFGKVAAMLEYKQYGKNNILRLLRDEGIFMSDNIPYREYIERGYFKSIPKPLSGIDKTVMVPFASAKGIDKVRQLIEKDLLND